MGMERSNRNRSINFKNVSISYVVMEVYNENHNKTILNVSISYMGMERTSLYRIVGTDDLYQSPIRVWNT